MPSQRRATMTARRKRVVAVGVGVGIACLLLLGLSLAVSSPAPRLVGRLAPLGVDLAEPDWLIVIRRNTVTRLMGTAARLALKDRYLAEVSGGVPAGGSVVPAYALQRSSRQTLLFAAHGDRLVIVSDAGMVLDADGKVSAAARPVLEALLGEAR